MRHFFSCARRIFLVACTIIFVSSSPFSNAAMLKKKKTKLLLSDQKRKIDELQAKLDIAEKAASNQPLYAARLCELEEKLTQSEEEIAKLRLESEQGRAKKWFRAIATGDLRTLENMHEQGESRIQSRSTFPEICLEGYTSLMCAAFSSQENVVAWLIGHNANVNAFNDSKIPESSGLTALMIAVGQNHFGVTELLLASGADPNAGRVNAGAQAGVTPIVFAAMGGHSGMFDLLLKFGATLDDVGVFNLIYQTAKKNQPEGMIRLLELGAPLPKDQIELRIAHNFAESSTNAYLLALLEAAKAGKRDVFLAKREHEVLLEIAKNSDFPAPIAHILAEMTLGRMRFVKPTTKIEEIKHALGLLKTLQHGE
jgi:hypothetical protein